MISPSEPEVERRLTTPRAAAVAGLLFALLFATVLILIRTALPEDLSATSAAIQRAAGQLRVAVTLMPFAGIAFLWFVGVVRDRLGELEDRFFASVMFGSALLFLAMLFVAMALAGGLLAAAGAPSIRWTRRSSGSAGRSCCRSAMCTRSAWPASS